MSAPDWLGQPLADIASLDALLAPRSIAIVGATERPQYGGRFLQNLLRTGYPGRLYPVNPHRDRVFDLPCHPSLGDLPERPDLVAVIIPAPGVPAALREAAECGAKAALVVSAGFAETQSVEGERFQTEMRAISAATGLRVCGPNCLGIANLHANVWATANVLVPIDERLRAGPVAIVSQSGATAFGPLLAIARERAIGIHSVISSGNETDLEFADYAAHLLRQPAVGAVAGVVEGIADGRKLLRAAAVAREFDKPIVVLKLGRSAVGQTAARLHTATLAGDDAITMAALRQAGIVVVDDYDLLLEVAAALATGRRPAGRRVAVLSHSGGIGGLLGDQCGQLGLNLPPLSPTTAARLGEILAGRGSATNPVDITGHFERETFGEIAGLLLADPAVDALAIASAGENAARLTVEAAATTPKPVLFTWVGPIEHPGCDLLRGGGIPTFLLPGRCARALAALADLAAWRQRLPEAVRVLAEEGASDGATRRRGDPLRGGKRVKGKRAKLRFPLFPFSPLPLT
ncbi:MAG: CoA-binding protein, partial [Chloroflexi bacterium]|nr:CoA-binding protein [Chloroflexota bacterium]